LDARLIARRDDFLLDLELTAEPGETVVLLGPNGAGKSTALRILAGLLPLDRAPLNRTPLSPVRAGLDPPDSGQLPSGHVRLDGTCLDCPAEGAWIPPARRRIGVVFQDYLLFPHLSALDNVAFGPRSAGMSRAQARRTAQGWLGLVDLGGQAGTRPRALSGGQQQRVALARALATDPRLLLLDEPLAALDARTRLEVRGELRRQLHGFGGATVLVTHDPLDAMVLADRLVILEQGAVVQCGAPAEVARRPRTDYVAQLVGLNLLRGEAFGDRVVVDGGGELLGAGSVSGQALVAFRPAAVALYRTRPSGSPRNVWPVTVAGVEPCGTAVRVELAGEFPVVAEVTTAAVAELGVMPGVELWASVKASEVDLYPA
jgi:molybdate transport system ATP-binding protein